MLRQYYFKYLPPMVLVVVLLAFSGISIFYLLFFLTAYSWPLAIYAPNIEEWVAKNRHNFSFIAVIVRSNKILLEKLKPTNDLQSKIAESLLPLLFCLLLSLFSDFWGMFFALLGLLTFHSIQIVEKVYRSRFGR
ncbi:MAG: hypothetical protein A2504_06055 [Bdellovibrionales bacterium RIFOXYD12_FULL_39_22]|nr:MAG: hypothetical protein A2385_08375 [Bdellovibrionales bacterium RIFOXYB1_FULL_39_21]OFZ45281.1 MAG: hypothetical protein A2485_06160 [Bdellovibrionales bacterium RIFOXYC12_FULL_39_17]OFZ45529.1 MAG: hypothetical protein A2404_02955 [Bdellovibrionales bacterium RIFOXYC1_FULL_39_130]OFZ77390.1 MAG: hypothetical protein A2560_08545 [Bdellovibrionales bacterium RIFOXYD1_FULL_39_84]OFZ91519.1 MAG: hypothetical protein A2504_06055 [Bdellovibrionales bacterium RIFOXYD12_FULL_39_22]HLE12024.1 hy